MSHKNYLGFDAGGVQFLSLLSGDVYFIYYKEQQQHLISSFFDYNVIISLYSTVYKFKCI